MPLPCSANAMREPGYLIRILGEEGRSPRSFMFRELRSSKIVQRAAAFGKARPWAFSIWLPLAVGAVYYLAARLGLALLTNPDGVAVFWPAAGIAAGVLIRMGPVARIAVVVGTVAGTIAANLLGDRNFWSAIVFAAC